MREKVDRFNLDEFGKRLDNKLNNEISKKIDKHDLKKNNVMFNKKVIYLLFSLIILKIKYLKHLLTHLLIFKWKKLLLF